MTNLRRIYFVVHGKLTTTADNNLGEVRMAELPDRILITVAKCRVHTHHNALRFSTVSHQTVGLAQARPNYIIILRLATLSEIINQIEMHTFKTSIKTKKITTNTENLTQMNFDTFYTKFLDTF